MRFIIPADISQLFEDGGGDSLRCSDMRDELDTSELRDLMYELNSEDAVHVTENQSVFEQLCICTRGLKNLQLKDKSKLIERMASNLSDLASSVNRLVDEPDFSAAEDVAQSHCDAISIFVYFISCAVSHFVDDFKLEHAEASQGQPRTQKGRGPRRPVASLDESAVQVALDSMLDISKANLTRLFDTETGLLRAMSCCMKVALQAFELPGMSSRHAVFPLCVELLAICCAKYQLHEHTAPALMTLVRSSDKMVDVPAAVAEVAEHKFGSRHLVVSLIEEFCKTGPQDFTEDVKDSSSIVKRQAQFLSQLAEKVPKSFCQQVSLLLPYLGSGAQTIRGELLTCLQHLIKWSCNQGAPQIVGIGDEGAEETNAAATQRILTKQHLYDILMERFFDKSALNRQRVCKIWRELVESGSGSATPYVPLGLRKQLLPEMAVERLDDTQLVVKQAVSLLLALLMNHPFKDETNNFPFLDLDAFKASLQETEQRLEELQAERDAHERPQMEPPTAAQPHDGEGAADEDTMDVDGGEEAGDPATPARARSGPSAHTTAPPRTQPRTPANGLEIERLRVTRATLAAAVEFIEVYVVALPKLKQLLTTQPAEVVKEVIKVISLCKMLRIPGAAETLRATWGLVFSTEEDVRIAAVDAWHDMYLTPGKEHPTPEAIALHVMSQLDGCTDGDIQAATKIVRSIAAQKKLRTRIINATCIVVDRLYTSALTGLAQGGKANDPDMRLLRCGLLFISMLAQARPEQMHTGNQLQLIWQVGFCNKLNDAWLVRHACITLQHLAPELCGLEEAASDNSQRATRVSLRALTKVLLASRLPENNWYSAAQAAVQAIFRLHHKPNNFMAKILQALETTIKQPKVSAIALSRFIFVLSHTALSLLAYIDRVTRKAKLVRMEQASKAAENAAAQQQDNANDIEAELGVGLATVDLELDMLKEHIEAELLDPKHLMGAHAKLLSEFLTNSYKSGSLAQMHPELRQAACLALTKLMVVDKQYCEDNVSLLFSILTKEDVGTTLQRNILIALGDLNVHFPNTMEPWTEKMYEPLSGNDLEVKKTCVTVLTFLLLNDMIKVKGHIYKLALLLRDPDVEVQQLATRFWNELAKKAHRGQNPIFNLLLDIISNLSSIPTLSSDDFDHILTFLLDKVDKDKHVDHLKERLCVRLEAIHDDYHQWHKLAMCLTKLKYTEKGTRRVIELLKHYKHTFVDQVMVKEFKKLSDRLRKNSDKKAELKQMADDFDQEIDAIVKALVGEEEEERVADGVIQPEEQPQDADGIPQSGSQQVRVKVEDTEEQAPVRASRRNSNTRQAPTRAPTNKKVANLRATRRTRQTQPQVSSDEESHDVTADASEEELSGDDGGDVQQSQPAVRQRSRNARDSQQVEHISRRVQQLNLQSTRTRRQTVRAASVQEDSDEEMEE